MRRYKLIQYKTLPYELSLNFHAGDGVKYSDNYDGFDLINIHRYKSSVRPVDAKQESFRKVQLMIHPRFKVTEDNMSLRRE